MPTEIGEHLPEVPVDPRNEDPYVYGWINNEPDSQRFCAWARLEAEVDGKVVFFAVSHKGVNEDLETAPTTLDCW